MILIPILVWLAYLFLAKIFREVNKRITAALIFFFMLIWGGFRYMSAGGDPKNADAARQTLTNATVGLLIVVASFVIIEVVTRVTKTGVNIFNP